MKIKLNQIIKLKSQNETKSNINFVIMIISHPGDCCAGSSSSQPPVSLVFLNQLGDIRAALTPVHHSNNKCLEIKKRKI